MEGAEEVGLKRNVWGSMNIAPYSKISFSYSPSFQKCVMDKLEVSFLMNYFFLLIESLSQKKKS